MSITTIVRDIAAATKIADSDDADTRFRKHRIRVMLAITLGYGFIYTIRIGMSIVKKPLIDGGIFTVEETGYIGAALLYGYMFGKFVNGFLADHFPPRLFFTSAIVISCFMNLLMGWSEIFVLSVILWALNGWFQGMAAPSAVVSITNWFSLHERGRRYGIWNASHSIGEGITFYLTAAVVAATTWKMGFILPGIVCLGVAAWVYAYLQNAPPTIGLPDIHEWANEPTEEDKGKTTWEKQKVVFGIGAIWVLGASSALMYATRYGINSWGVLYLQETHGYSLLEAGFFLMVNTLAGIVGSIAYGYLSDKVFDARRPPANLLFAVIEVAALFMIFFGPKDPWFLALSFALYGATLSGLMASLGGLFAVDIAPRGAAGAAMGFIGLFSYFAAGTQDIISGILIGQSVQQIGDGQVYDFSSAIFFWVGSSIVSMVLAASLWNTKIRD